MNTQHNRQIIGFTNGQNFKLNTSYKMPLDGLKPNHLVLTSLSGVKHICNPYNGLCYEIY